LDINGLPTAEAQDKVCSKHQGCTACCC
jgi:hypothetical protein